MQQALQQQQCCSWVRPPPPPPWRPVSCSDRCRLRQPQVGARSSSSPPTAAAAAAASSAAANHDSSSSSSSSSPLSRRELLLSSSVGLVSSGAGCSSAGAAEQPRGEAAAAGDAGAAAAGKRGAKKRKKTAARAPKAGAPRPPGKVPRVKLASNLNISRVIRGCWQLDGQHRGDAMSDRTMGAAAVEDLDTFCRHGITTLDTADNYNGSEVLVGQHLRLNPDAAVTTQVLTKLTFMTPPSATDLRKDNIEYRLRASIARLGVTTLDLVQLHWEPAPAPPPAAGSKARQQHIPGFVAAARALQQLQGEGIVRQIGVSNFDVPMLMALLDAGVTPLTNQVAYSVIDRRPQLFLPRFCEQNEIQLLAYGTLAGGFLAERYLDMPADKARIDTLSKARYGNLLGQLGGWAWMQDVLQALHDIGTKHGVSASVVASRWVLQQRGVAAVIVGARNANHVRDLQRLFSPGFELDDDDLLALDAAYEGANQPTTDVYAWERGGEW